VRYRYTRLGLEQDVLIESQLPEPEEFGLDSADCFLQVLTEFVTPNRPKASARAVRLDSGLIVQDEDLAFGAIRFGHGKAFSLEPAERQDDMPVFKQWLETEGRRVLIEQVPFLEFKTRAQSLPPYEGASMDRSGKATRRLASTTRQLPAPPQGKAKPGPMELASLAAPAKGVLLDYTTVGSSGNNYVFAGGNTYYISGPVSLTGTTVLEGACTIKMTASSTASIQTVNVVSLAQPYAPVVITAADDNTLGETISGSTGNPSTKYYGKIALDFTGAGTLPTLSNLRFCYLSNAVAGANLTLQNVQFVKCKTAFASGSTSPTINNGLIWNVGTFLNNSAGTTLTAHHLTAHYCTNFLANTSGTVNLTNCLMVCVTNWQCATTRTNASTFLNSDSDVFQVVGGGSHYLAASSPYRDIGTTNIPASILSNLRVKTTYPPVVFSNVTISAATQLSPQAQRDWGFPDQGYHYDPLDYAFGGATASADVTVAAGTAVGWFRTSSGWNHAGHGIRLEDSRQITFDGRAESPAYWARCCAVQEGCNGLWQGGYGPGGITGWTALNSFNSAPTVTLRFTKCSMGGDPAAHFRDDAGYLAVNAANSEFIGGSLGGYATALTATNCLMDRINLWTSWTDSGGASTNCVVTLRNCTLHGGTAALARASVSVPKAYPFWLIYDSAFDGTTTNFNDGAAGLASVTAFNYNAFLSGQARLTPAGANDVIVSGSFGWQSGSLGAYYLPSTSTLINTGSLASAASAGLYHFTTQTNQTKELTSRLDIGYHVMALNASGQPADTDTDGTPDYFEDFSGNGSVDSGETDWQNANDLGLKVLILRPASNSPIP
jgi:hypothetical protein